MAGQTLLGATATRWALLCWVHRQPSSPIQPTQVNVSGGKEGPSLLGNKLARVTTTVKPGSNRQQNAPLAHQPKTILPMDIYEDDDKLPDLEDYEREADSKTSSTTPPSPRRPKNLSSGIVCAIAFPFGKQC
jgi:hypothetical protein